MSALWKILALGAGVLSAKYTRTVVDGTWRKARGTDPPKNPASRETDLREALAFAVATGAAVGVARLLAQRGAAGAWRKVAGQNPPGLEET